MSELPKTYDPQAIEAKWYDWWKQRGFFRAEAEWGGQPYTIVIPPPNVTGILHMGHALNETIQDVMIRPSACRASTRCGCRGLTMPASPRKTWWSAN